MVVMPWLWLGIGERKREEEEEVEGGWVSLKLPYPCYAVLRLGVVTFKSQVNR